MVPGITRIQSPRFFHPNETFEDDHGLEMWSGVFHPSHDTFPTICITNQSLLPVFLRSSDILGKLTLLHERDIFILPRSDVPSFKGVAHGAAVFPIRTDKSEIATNLPNEPSSPLGEAPTVPDTPDNVFSTASHTDDSHDDTPSLVHLTSNVFDLASPRSDPSGHPRDPPFSLHPSPPPVVSRSMPLRWLRPFNH